MPLVTRPILEEEKSLYNQAVSHPMQTWEWGEFRQKTGNDVIRLGVFDGKNLISAYQVIFSPLPVPKTHFTIGGLIKGPLPDQEMINSLKKLAAQKMAVFIKLEPNVFHPISSPQAGWDNIRQFLENQNALPGKHLFTPYTFILDLQKTEDQLLANMHPKTRYNIRLAQKHSVTVEESATPQTLESYIQLFKQTTKRQQFEMHTENYHRLLWETLVPKGLAKVLIAKYQNQILAAYMLFVHKDTLYYPYGWSASNHREVMPTNLLMWSSILLGKKLGLKKFDMWGSLGPDADPHHHWYGWHNFKQGFGPEIYQFLGTYDLVTNFPFYQIYQKIDPLRWSLIRLRQRLPF